MAENLWPDATHAHSYLERADSVPHRGEGESALLELLPQNVGRVLDLGCGDGRLLQLALSARPGASGVAVDFSEVMLAAARERFAGTEVDVVEHDLDRSLPDLGSFDAVISSFAIHHVADERKRSLYAEIYDRLGAGGAFLNLEHVTSPTGRLHDEFMALMGERPGHEDPSNQLAPVEPQLAWMRDIGFTDVDCHWKWRELALLGGVRPARG